MENLISGTFIVIVICVILLIKVVKYIIDFLIFKWKCSILAETIAEKMRDELDDIIDNLEIKMN